MLRTLTLTAALLLTVTVAAGPALADGQEDPRPRSSADRPGHGHLEVPHDPPAPPAEVASRLKSEPTPVIRNGFVSVQANIDADGLNILDDAANEPSLAVDPMAPNRIAVGWRQFDSITSDFRRAGVAHSVDGGRSWTFPGSLDPDSFRSDPVLASDAEGIFYYNSLTVRQPIGILECDFFISSDGGRTWSEPISAFGGDKLWMAIDTTGGPGHGNIYTAWTTAGGCCGDRIFTYSTDGGATFSDPVRLLPSPIWGTMAVGPDGTLYIVGNEDYNFGRFILLRSTNADDPASEPTFQTLSVDMGGRQGSGGPPNPGGLLGQVWLGVDYRPGPLHGNLYVVSSIDPPGSDPMNVHFVRSTDRGQTWSEPVTLHSDDRNAWQWFATMSVAPNGRIDVVWIESLNSAQPNVGEMYYTSSSDGGITWSTPVAVTPTFDSHLGWPQQQKMGDYFHMVSDRVGAHLIFAATFNGEEDVYYMRLGDYDCNDNGVGDTADIADGTAEDCNTNGIPDSCELAAGTASDIDGDGRLDECEFGFVVPRNAGIRVVPE